MSEHGNGNGSMTRWIVGVGGSFLVAATVYAASTVPKSIESVKAEAAAAWAKANTLETTVAVIAAQRAARDEDTNRRLESIERKLDRALSRYGAEKAER